MPGGSNKAPWHQESPSDTLLQAASLSAFQPMLWDAPPAGGVRGGGGGHRGCLCPAGRAGGVDVHRSIPLILQLRPTLLPSYPLVAVVSLPSGSGAAAGWWTKHRRCITDSHL